MNQIDTRESKVLFSLLSKALFNKEADIDISDIDFSALYKEAKVQRVEGIVFSVLPNNLPDDCDDVYGEWYTRTMYTVSNNINVSNSHAQINNLMQKNGIPYCIIKGCASSVHYPSPVYRSMGDVDFLVKPSDVEKTAAVLKANGFEMAEDAEEHSYHVAYCKNKIHYELHYAIAEEVDGYGSSADFAEEVLKEAEVLPLYKNLGDIVVCSEKHHCLIMLAHMKKHMVMYGMGLRHLCDWAVFINKFSSEEFTDKFKAAIEEAGFWKFAQAMSQISAIYLGADYKDWFGKADGKNSAELMEYIFASGNFGRKRKGIDWMFIEPSKKNTGGMALQFSRSYLWLVGEMFPNAKNNKFLYALCFVYAPFRYIFRVLTGKRKWYNPVKVYKSGKETNKDSKIVDKYKDN